MVGLCVHYMSVGRGGQASVGAWVAGLCVYCVGREQSVVSQPCLPACLPAAGRIHARTHIHTYIMSTMQRKSFTRRRWAATRRCSPSSSRRSSPPACACVLQTCVPIFIQMCG